MSSKQKRWESLDKASIDIKVLVDHYISACRSAGFSDKTIRGYNEKLGRYVRQVGGTLGDFTLDRVREHLTSLKDAKKWSTHPGIPTKKKSLSPTTVRHHGMILLGFSRWLFEEGYTESKVLAGLKLPRADIVSMEPLSDEEIKRLIAYFNLNTEIGCRNAAITWLFLDTGLRCAEMVGMDMDNLFLETKRLKILGKGRKERILPFGHQSKRLLDRYIYHFRPESIYGKVVFLTSEGYPITDNTIRMFIERASKKTGIARLHVHLLRHTFATKFVLDGGDTMWLQLIMGHENLETTQRYIKRGAVQQIVLNKALSPMDDILLPRRIGARAG
jgi:site-specific recombinase XerD